MGRRARRIHIDRSRIRDVPAGRANTDRKQSGDQGDR
jgi:hypothetical protein